jgi:hypothetical protein
MILEIFVIKVSEKIKLFYVPKVIILGNLTGQEQQKYSCTNTLFRSLLDL